MKKKFTMLFAALLAFVGVAKAQLVETSTAEAPKYYVIASYSRGGFLTNAGVGTGLTHVDLSDAGYWYFEKANEDGGVYIVNKTLSGEDKVYVGSDRTASTTAAVWYIVENGVNKKGLSISSTATISSNSCIDASNNSASVGTWAPNAGDWDGTTWVLVEAAILQDAIYNPNGLVFRTRADRYVTSVALNGTFNNSAEVNHDYKGANGLVYNDLTETVTMRAVAGEDVTASLTRNGAWTNAYVYIDYDNDGFTAGLDTDGYTPTGDLCSYSFYNSTNDDGPGFNSVGTELSGTDRNTIVMPAFKAPATPGTYRMRFKHDWSNYDPNALGDGNGCSFIDVTLEVVSSTIEVQYSYQYNGVEKYTQTSEVLVGDEFPALNQTLPYGVTATKPAGNIAENDVVDGVVAKTIELAVNLPFTYASDYASIEHWYYMNIRDVDPTYLAYDSSKEYIPATASSVPDDGKDNYTWAFIGDPFNGFQIVNYAAGNTMVLSAPEAPTGDQNAAQLARMVAKESATGNTTWMFYSSTHNNAATNSFYIQHPTATAYAFNRQDYNSAKTLCYWNSRDTGSAVQLVERPMGPVAELAALIEEIEAAGIVCGTNPGEYTEASVNDLNEAVAKAKTVGSSATENDLNALQTAYDALDVNPITAGKYFIVNAKPAFNNNKVLTTYGVCGWYGTANTPAWTEKNTNDPLQYFEIEVSGETYSLKSAYEGSYVTSINTLGDEPADVTFTWKGPGQYNITINGGVFHANLHGWGVNSSDIVNYGGEADSPSAWKLVAVTEEPTFTHTLTVGDAEWSTIVLGYNATIPTADGFKVYTIASQEDGYVMLEEVTGVLGANVPVLVNAPAGEYVFNSTTTVATVTESGLAGTLYNKNITAEAYVLANGTNGVGLYKAKFNVVDLDKEVDADGDGDATNDYTAFLNNANKAYLPAPAGAEAAMFSLERGEGTTGIETAVSGEQTVVIYDLAGRRVEKMEKGIYIVNGKKVIR